MGAEYLLYMKYIETHARAFLALIILGIGTVARISGSEKNLPVYKVLLENQLSAVTNPFT